MVDVKYDKLYNHSLLIKELLKEGPIVLLRYLAKLIEQDAALGFTLRLSNIFKL